MSSQIALPLSQRSDADPDRIVIGSANQAAIDALADPSSWPFHSAILAGPPRSGKSLLARWFAAQGAGDVIDGAERLEETEIFHRWNRAQENGRPLLLVTDSEGWEINLPDLRSRVGAALHIAIESPDDEMAAALLESHAARRGLVLGEGAPTYLVPRMERSFAAIEGLVAAIDRLSLERKAPATMSIWRDALEAVQGPEQARLL